VFQNVGSFSGGYRSGFAMFYSGENCDGPYNENLDTHSKRGYVEFSVENFPENITVNSVILNGSSLRTGLDGGSYLATVYVSSTLDAPSSMDEENLFYNNNSVYGSFGSNASLRDFSLNLGNNGIENFNDSLSTGWFGVKFSAQNEIDISDLSLIVNYTDKDMFPCCFSSNSSNLQRVW
jgi:hypothetical protein